MLFAGKEKNYFTNNHAFYQNSLYSLQNRQESVLIQQAAIKLRLDPFVMSVTEQKNNYFQSFWPLPNIFLLETKWLIYG